MTQPFEGHESSVKTFASGQVGYSDLTATLSNCGEALKPYSPSNCGNTLVARLIASGMVTVVRINVKNGLSAAKS